MEFWLDVGAWAPKDATHQKNDIWLNYFFSQSRHHDKLKLWQNKVSNFKSESFLVAT